MATSITNTSITTDDITVDTNVLKVDSSNNRVGIGTASPSYTLHSSTSTGSDYAGFFHNGAGSGNGTALVAKGGANNSGAGTFIVQDYGGNEDFKVDGLGRIYMPNVPRFLARINQSGWTPSTNAIMVWDRTDIHGGYNVGGHYNTSNGQFTCPVTGTYYFEATTIVNTAASNAAWYLRKNGSAIHEQHISQTNNSWQAHHIAFTGEFAANDTVDIQNGNTSLGYYGSAWSYFHGRMIG